MAETTTHRIFIVDDHPVVREGLKLRIENHPELNVCGEAEDTGAALQMIEELKPDIAIVDIQLRESNGLDLIKRLKALPNGPRVLVWSMYDEELYGERALRAGALGYVSKRDATRRIVDAIHRVLEDKIYVSDSLASTMLQRAVGNKDGETRQGVELLSDRELEVFQLIGSGRATSEIATNLTVSVKTVETHRQRIRAKLGLKNGAELVRFAVQWVLENG